MALRCSWAFAMWKILRAWLTLRIPVAGILVKRQLNLFVEGRAEDGPWDPARDLRSA